MSNKVTNRQIFFILVLTLTAYTTINLPKIAAQEVGTSGWITILLLAVVFGGAAYIITKLGLLFPGQAIYDYSQNLAGGFIAKTISIYYILYFFVVGVNLKVKLAHMTQENFLPKTPRYIVLAVSVGLFAYVSYRGITSIARMFELFGTVYLVTTLLLCLAASPQGMLYNILPVFNPLEAKSIFTAIPRFLFTFGGVEVLLVIPLTRTNKKAPRVAFFTVLFIGLFYVLIVETTIKVLGINNTILYNDSLIEAIRVIQIPVLERTDIFYLTVGLTSLFSGLIAVYVSLLEHAVKLVPKLSRKKLTILIGILMFGTCMLVINRHDIGVILDRYLSIPILISGFIIPSVLLLIAKFKGKNKGRA